MYRYSNETHGSVRPSSFGGNHDHHFDDGTFESSKVVTEERSGWQQALSVLTIILRVLSLIGSVRR